MGKGEELGRELRHWITVDRWTPSSGPALANRLIDVLGADDSLKAPLRDLAGQPLFLQLLRQPQGASSAAVESLVGLLSRTYAPGVLAELKALILIATAHQLPAGTDPLSPSSAAGPRLAAGAASVAGTPPPQAIRLPGETTVAAGNGFSPERADLPMDRDLDRDLDRARDQQADRASLDPGETLPAPAAPRADGLARPSLPLSRRWLAAELVALGPGLALGFSVSLVLAWAAAQLDRTVLEAWGWSAGVFLALLLLVLQIGSSGPLRRLRRHALLSLPTCAEPQLTWRWITAPWLHARGGEALTHVLLLLILLGPSPLPLNQLVLRYSLTALATELLAVLSARACGMVSRRWGGGSGPVAALISLAACLSLLNWRELGFRLGWPGNLVVPAWVLLVIYASLQLAWQLPRRGSEDASRPADRLWSSTWWWGTWCGVGWGLLTWLLAWAGRLLPHAPAH